MRPRALATLLTLILALALGASGPLRAFTHGADAGLTAMVICGEGGARTVYLDDAGQPADPARSCLADPCDACVPSEPGAIGVHLTMAAPLGRAHALAARPEPDEPNTRRTSTVKARGPPAGDDLA